MGWLISIHPRHAEAILSGTKTVECRKSGLGLSAGDLLFVYSTAPAMAVGGVAEVAAVRSGAPEEMWEAFGGRTGVSREEFMAYYAGAAKAFVVELAGVRRLESPVGLARIRAAQPGFAPPQTARRLSGAALALLSSAKRLQVVGGADPKPA